MTRACIILAVLLASCAFAAESDYTEFSAFRDSVWGAEQDSLYYVHFGEAMGFGSGGSWERASENSAAIAFNTLLPAEAYVAYGAVLDTLSWSANDTTDHGDGNYFTHLRYITGLTANTKYYFRYVGTDERANTVKSAVDSFTTLATGRASVRYIDGTGSFPQVLAADSTYVLTGDVDADQRAFTIAGDNCVLDLNGYAITYDNTESCLPNPYHPDNPSGTTWDEYRDSSCSSFGIFVNNGVTASIFGGSITQGDGLHSGDYNIGYGFNPIFVWSDSADDIEIAGMTVSYGGNFLSGITCRSGSGSIHHNVIRDFGTLVGNRDQGRKAITAGDWGSYSIHHNLIKRCRQQGIVLPDSVRDNEIYIDSWSTNSYGVKPHANVQMLRNKCFGTGYHAIGLGWALGSCDSLVYRDNFIHMRGTAPTDRDTEYGTTSSVVGIRHTQYNGINYDYNNFLVENNTVIIEVQDSCEDARGIQITSDDHVLNYRVRNNVFKSNTLDASTTPNACVFLMGQENDWANALPVVYEDNVFIANETHVCANDNYQIGGNHQFRNCEFRKFGARATYVTIDIGYYFWDSYGNRFIDCTVSGGANLEDNSFDGSPGGLRNYAVGGAVWIMATSDGSTPITATAVTSDDDTGWASSDTTDGSGVARLELIEYDYEAAAGAGVATRTDHSTPGDWYFVAGTDSVQVTAEIWDATTSESVPLTINFSSGGTVPGLTFDTATVTSNVLTVTWTDGSSTEWQVQATINGTTSYTILVDSASASFPVAAGTIDIKVTGDASGVTQGQASN
jgi:hypothetical protein